MAEIEKYNYKKILMKNLCFVFLALILLSCKEQKDSSHKEYVFNKSTATDNDLNKLFSDVDYIPLESTNETLIGFNPQLYVSSSKYTYMIISIIREYWCLIAREGLSDLLVM